MKRLHEWGARITCVTAVLAALGAPSAQISAQVSDAAAVVMEREIAFAKTMADRDLDGFATFVAEEAVFFAGNEPQRGRDAIVEGWRAFFSGPTPPFSWHPDVVEVLDSGRLALSSGPVRSPTGEVVGRFNSVWRLEADGRWLVVFDKGS